MRWWHHVFGFTQDAFRVHSDNPLFTENLFTYIIIIWSNKKNPLYDSAQQKCCSTELEKGLDIYRVRPLPPLLCTLGLSRLLRTRSHRRAPVLAAFSSALLLGRSTLSSSLPSFILSGMTASQELLPQNKKPKKWRRSTENNSYFLATSAPQSQKFLPVNLDHVSELFVHLFEESSRPKLLLL